MKIFRVSTVDSDGLNIRQVNTHLVDISANELSVSDGYHTIEELYEHRHALFCALVKVYDNYITPIGGTRIKCGKSRLHSDGTMFDDSFIVWMRFNNLGDDKEYQISYHLPLSWWDRFKISEYALAPRWDGHTPHDVIERLLML